MDITEGHREWPHHNPDFIVHGCVTGSFGRGLTGWTPPGPLPDSEPDPAAAARYLAHLLSDEEYMEASLTHRALSDTERADITWHRTQEDR